MNKLKLLVSSILASAFVFLGGAVASISVFAEESAEMPEISVESVIDEELIEEKGKYYQLYTGMKAGDVDA